jgi:hypothetical protein
LGSWRRSRPAKGLIPSTRNAAVVEAIITLNYTTVLNVIFLTLAAVLVIRFLRTGGRGMLAMMDMSTDEMRMEMGESESNPDDALRRNRSPRRPALDVQAQNLSRRSGGERTTASRFWVAQPGAPTV